MDQTFPKLLSEAEMEAEIDRMQAETRVILEEIKAERQRGDLSWREAKRLSVSNTKMLDKIGDILRAARD